MVGEAGTGFGGSQAPTAPAGCVLAESSPRRPTEPPTNLFATTNGGTMS